MKHTLWSRWHQRGQARRRVRLGLELLEDRTVPAIFNVGPGDVATLIADINTANGNGQSNIINLTASTYDLTAIDNYWYGPNGLPAIASNLTIHGNGAVLQRDSSAPDFRLIYVSGGMELSPGSLSMDNVTLQGGIAKGGDSNHGGGGLGAGGAIFNQGTLNLTDVTLTNNQALGGSSGVATAGDGGGGMGQDAPSNGDGGGFGGSLGGPYGGSGGTGAPGGGGGGGGFLTGANGANATTTAPGSGGGRGGFARFGGDADGGSGGSGNGSAQANGFAAGGNFGFGGGNGLGTGGGGGGIGGGGGAAQGTGGNGGFGGGGGAGSTSGTGNGGGQGGFGGGNGGADSGSSTGRGGDGLGGAIFNMGAYSAQAGSGQATLINCTLTANIAQGGTGNGINGGSGVGGALYNLDGAVNLTNDTIVDNKVVSENFLPGPPVEGVNVMNEAYGNDIATGNPITATLIINNSILANPDAAVLGVDVSSYVSTGNTATVNGGHNLITDTLGLPSGLAVSSADPMLGPLQNNGGLTPTLLPQSGSPVLGAGDPRLAPATDQRGQPRPTNGPIDLGSVQVSAASTGGGSGGGGMGNTASPPSLFQALLSLYIDGAVYQLNNLTYEFIHGDNFNIDNYFGTPSQLAMVRANAAAAGVNYDAIGPLMGSLAQFTGHTALNYLNDLHFNFPYAGPFAWFAVAAGAQAANQAVHL